MNRTRVLLWLVRYGLPLALGIAGLILIVIGHGGGRAVAIPAGDTSIPTTSSGTTAAVGVALIVLGLLTGLINWLYRTSIASNRDRELEEAAREHFARTGRWPEDE
jgi:hypothetical protein